MCVCSCVCTSVRKPGVGIRCLPLLSSLLFCNQSLSLILELTVCLHCLSRKLSFNADSIPPILLSPQSCDSRHVPPCPLFEVSAGAPNSCSHVRTASASLTKPCPWSLVQILSVVTPADVSLWLTQLLWVTDGLVCNTSTLPGLPSWTWMETFVCSVLDLGRICAYVSHGGYLTQRWGTLNNLCRSF